MTAPSDFQHRADAKALFARLLARHERGDEVDFDREARQRPELAEELRKLHRSWRKVEGLLSSIGGHDAALEEIERDLAGTPGAPDNSFRAEIERLAAPERGARRYERQGLLARGGMGEVWRVLDLDLGRVLAMKLLKPRRGGTNTALLGRFLREARLTARLDHPGIVPVHDLGVDGEGRVWFTMPLVRGESLAAVLGREGANLAHVLEILLKVCDAVAYAHSQGVVHRDLKPSNILVGRFGEVHVVDWGLARALSQREDLAAGEGLGEPLPDFAPASGHDETRFGDVLGTPHYMAPEQAAGRASGAGPPADVYALGAILRHALAGRPPHAGAESDAVRAVIAGPPAPLGLEAPDAAPELVAICERAMAREPGERYGSVQAMGRDLRAWLEGRVVLAHRTGPWPELAKWLQRNRALAVAIAAALLLSLLGAAAWSWQRTRGAAEILRLADVVRLRELVHRAEEIGPASSENRPEMEAWLARAEELVAHEPQHARALEELRARAPEGPGDGALSFATEEERFRHGLLAELVDGLRRISDPDPRIGTIAAVRSRVEIARLLERASLTDASPAWKSTIEDLDREPRYRGFRIKPIRGFVPLGRDPETGLLELAHLASGVPPGRDASGHLVLDERSAIVFVLLEGGRFHMGSPSPGDGGIPATDPWARPEEGPGRFVELAPFLCAKYEVSQGQWQRLGGETCSRHGRDLDPARASLLPVDSVDWTAAHLVLERAGLALPSEAQWEYAARGGATSRWWCGNEPGSLRGAVNGRTAPDPRLSETRSEGGPVPLATLAPNGFGLYHVLGNLAEWTGDPWSDEPTAGLRPGDGLRIGADRGLRAVRGGSYSSEAAELRCAARLDAQVELRDRHIGVRACREL